MRTLPTLVTVVSLLGSLHAEVALDAMWRSGMVVQRDATVVLTGTCSPQEVVFIKASWGDAAQVTGTPDGRFALELRTDWAAGEGPHEMVVRGSTNEYMLTDVYLGDVWIASGQSNMEMPVGYMHDGYSGVTNWEEELTRASSPLVRVYTVENAVADAPLRNVKGTWSSATPDSIRTFSATAWYFARRVHEDTQVPIGIIAADWGGTPIESWMSAEALHGSGEFVEQVALLQERANDAAAHAAREQRRVDEWRASFDRAELGVKQGWQSGTFDDSAWREVQVPAPLPLQWGTHDGTVWLRRRVTIPAAWAGTPLRIEFPAVDDCDTTWWNGQRVGETMGAGRWNEARRYSVPAEAVQAGEAVLSVRVLDFSGAAGITGKYSDCKLVQTLSGESIPLGGFWRVALGSSNADLPLYPEPQVTSAWTPTALYNAMIAPLAGLRPRGAIWYQGESNRGRATQYAKLFPALVQDWRALFGKELAFYAVQIAPFGYGGDKGETGALREAQRSILALPRTGLVSTLDLGDPRDIHPKNKLEVGERLGRMALVDLYGWQQQMRAGPEPIECVRKLDTVAIRFANATGGLKALKVPLAGFEGRTADGKWWPVEAEILGDEVSLHAALPTPMQAVRYAWGTLDTATFVNLEGVPSCTFEMAVRP